MGLLDSLGLSGFLGGVNWSTIGNILAIVFLMVILAIITGAGFFGYYWKKLKKAQFINQIPIYRDIGGQIYRTGTDWAKELFVPDTNISLYFLKSRKIYIARPTRAMGKNEYWYKILSNGEWVNFDLSSGSEDTFATANYDHRDTRYAYVNLKEIIKRNYKDKTVQWWKEYSPLITFIIVSFIFIGGCWILLAKIGKLIDGMQPMIEQWKLISEMMASSVETAQNLNSGIVGV